MGATAFVAGSTGEVLQVLVLHIVAGLTSLACGYVALLAPKGGRVHRRGGVLFVAAMMLLSGSGIWLAFAAPDRMSAVGGALAAYLVITSVLAVRRRELSPRLVGVTSGLAGSGVVALGVGFAVVAMGTPDGMLDGDPAAGGLALAGVATLAVLGDLRVMTRGLSDSGWIMRHLWRMGAGLLMAAASFFLAQPQVFPPGLRDSGLLAVPVLIVPIVMAYWLLRIAWRRAHAGTDGRPGLPAKLVVRVQSPVGTPLAEPGDQPYRGDHGTGRGRY